ncbi:flagellar basal body rod protein FlgC [candidate division KSB1 bacterium]|nr:MAG: flagellar basal body rod protein FlgC [candidate division KSB1 bacterium]
MSIKKIFSAIDISAMGMSSQRKRMDAIASNIANIDTTRTETGGPYRRKIVLMREIPMVTEFGKILRSVSRHLSVTNKRHIAGGQLALKEKIINSGVEAIEVEQADNNVRVVYDPDHPDADEQGFVRLPNINIMTEMVDMITASRAYEANAMAIEAAKGMAKKALEI